MKYIKILLWVLIAAAVLVVGLLFAAANSDIVTVDYLIGTWETTLANIVIAAIIIGGLLGMLWGVMVRVMLGIHKHKKKKELAAIESKLNSMKVSAAKG